MARLAEKLSIDVEPITRRQLSELAEYDGLFIRETTSIDNHTYRFARRAWQEAGKAGCGRIIVLTKIDGDNINCSGLLDSIKESFGNGCIPLNVPVGIGDAVKGVVSTLNPPAKVDGGHRGSGSR